MFNVPGLQSRTGLRGRNHAESDRHTLRTWGNAVTGLLGTYLISSSDLLNMIPTTRPSNHLPENYPAACLLLPLALLAVLCDIALYAHLLLLVRLTASPNIDQI